MSTRRDYADRTRRLVDKTGAACAYLEGDPDPACFWLDDMPGNAKHVQRALELELCPLCFWSLIHFFGVKNVDVLTRSGKIAT